MGRLTFRGYIAKGLIEAGIKLDESNAEEIVEAVYKELKEGLFQIYGIGITIGSALTSNPKTWMKDFESFSKKFPLACDFLQDNGHAIPVKSPPKVKP